MLIALGVLFVSGLLTVAAFTAANGDINLSHRDTTQKEAYYAALAGIQEYEYKMQINPDYWQGCEAPSAKVSEGTSDHYEVKPLIASTAPVGTTACSTTKPFETMIESKGSVANTFRIESKGYAGSDKRSLVATFQVSGFLNYVYYTNYETEDTGLYPSSKPAPSGCSKKFYKERPSGCTSIQFISGDAVNGPLHTNDAADVCGSASFGRSGHSPLDVVEMNGGTYGSGCSGTPTYYTTSGSYTKGTELVPPQSDSSLKAYVESEYEFTGVTHIVLAGTEITVENAKKETKKLPWPKNGLIFVKQNEKEGEACEYTYKPEESDEAGEKEEETNCGTVYVSGTYSNSLTIGAENNLVINGNIYPTSVTGKLGSAPAGTVVLGLIANEYVRIYHPIVEAECEFEWKSSCSGGKNAAGSLENPWIYAAILSTQHSFAVDNYATGASLGNLNVYGAIAQNYRGIVGTGGNSSGTGYIKNYIYDERLAVDEPPYFLSPLNAGWKVARETAPNPG